MAKTVAEGQASDLSQMLGRAMGFHQRGQLADAEPLYRQILRIKPQHVEARHYFGILRFQQGRADEALDLIAGALAAKPDYAEAHYNRGNILAALGRFEDALASFTDAVVLQPDYAEAHHNHGNALLKLRRMEEAAASYERALALQPRYGEAWNGLGTALKELKRHADALECYDRVLALVPDEPNALYNRGNALKEIKRYDKSLASYEKARRLDPNHPDKFGGLDAALAVCDFERTEAMAAGLNAELAAGKASVTPFTLVGFCDDPALHLQAARNFVADRMPVRPAPLWTGEIYRHDRIRLAYLSADSANPCHRVPDGGAVRAARPRPLRGACVLVRSRRRQRLAPAHREGLRARFMMCSATVTRRLRRAARARDRHRRRSQGFHAGFRARKSSAHRPAPVQVGYLGYPGTMGADFLDYILADATVAPFEHAPFYAEKIVQLPDCYQVNDRARRVSVDADARGRGIAGRRLCVLLLQQQLQDPPARVRRLDAAAGGGARQRALAASRDNDGAARNLRNEAQARGIDPARLVFAGRVDARGSSRAPSAGRPVPRHAALQCPHDGSDALWMGVPVVTCQGNAFAGRVGASLLNAVGLPELVTQNLADYEALALRLAGDPAMLRGIRATLESNRLNQPLFDTDRFRRGIEAAYQRMWQTWQRGEAAQAFRVDEIRGRPR